MKKLLKDTEKPSDTKKNSKKKNQEIANDILLDLNTIKETLLFQKSEILNRNIEFKNSQTTIEKCPDEADLTAQELSNNLSIHLHERERKSLYSIDKALSKFAENTYGQCESCGDAIGLKRLQARPLAVFCISCMEESENSQRHNTFLQ